MQSGGVTCFYQKYYKLLVFIAYLIHSWKAATKIKKKIQKKL